MRTTVNIDDHLLARARDAARGRLKTLGQLIEDALRTELSDASGAAEPLPLPIFKGGTGPRPGVDLASNRAVNEALDEQTPLENLR